MTAPKQKFDWMPFAVSYAVVMGVFAVIVAARALFDCCLEINLWGV